MVLQSITEYNSYSFIRHFHVFLCLCLTPCICHCICLSYLNNDFHAFPKVATLPDTEPIASEARDIKIHQRGGRGPFRLSIKDAMDIMITTPKKPLRIPSEMEVAPHHTVFTLISLFTLFILFKLLYNSSVYAYINC